MLKLALSLAALLTLVSPALAKPKACVTPQALTAHAVQYRIEGETLVHFRDAADLVSTQKSLDADLFLVYGDDGDPIWTIIGFKNGCKIGVRLITPRTLKILLDGGGSV